MREIADYLFVGGSADGTIKTLGPFPTVRVQVRPPIPVNYYLQKAGSRIECNKMFIETYVDRTFRATEKWGEEAGFKVYALEGLSSADVLRNLLCNYRRGGK